MKDPALLVTKYTTDREVRWKDNGERVYVTGTKEDVLQVRFEMLCNGVPSRAFRALRRHAADREKWVLGVDKDKLARTLTYDNPIGFTTTYVRIADFLEEMHGNVVIMLLSQRPTDEWHRAVETRLNQILRQLHDLHELMEEHIDDEYKPTIRFTKKDIHTK